MNNWKIARESIKKQLQTKLRKITGYEINIHK